MEGIQADRVFYMASVEVMLIYQIKPNRVRKIIHEIFTDISRYFWRDMAVLP